MNFTVSFVLGPWYSRALCVGSENSLVRELFEGDAEDAKAAKGIRGKRGARGVSRSNMRMSMKKAAKQQAKSKKTTVGAEFKVGLRL